MFLVMENYFLCIFFFLVLLIQASGITFSISFHPHKIFLYLSPTFTFLIHFLYTSLLFK